jgi:hypothetical protein
MIQPILGLMTILILALAAYLLRHTGRVKYKQRRVPQHG